MILVSVFFFLQNDRYIYSSSAFTNKIYENSGVSVSKDTRFAYRTEYRAMNNIFWRIYSIESPDVSAVAALEFISTMRQTWVALQCNMLSNDPENQMNLIEAQVAVKFLRWKPYIWYWYHQKDIPEHTSLFSGKFVQMPELFILYSYCKNRICLSNFYHDQRSAAFHTILDFLTPGTTF